eukprot:scaffold203979_cov36-Tisochrysis_lutea.AAC.3
MMRTPSLVLAWRTSGYCVEEWLPQIMTPSTWSHGTPILLAASDWARLWSRRVNAEMFSLGIFGAAAERMAALVGLAMVGERLALLVEDSHVLCHHILALHSLLTREGAKEHRIVGILEGDGWIIRCDRASQERPTASDKGANGCLAPPSAVCAGGMSSRWSLTCGEGGRERISRVGAGLESEKREGIVPVSSRALQRARTGWSGPKTEPEASEGRSE